jgi:hypothetical protein
MEFMAYVETRTNWIDFTDETTRAWAKGTNRAANLDVLLLLLFLFPFVFKLASIYGTLENAFLFFFCSFVFLGFEYQLSIEAAKPDRLLTYSVRVETKQTN